MNCFHNNFNGNDVVIGDFGLVNVPEPDNLTRSDGIVLLLFFVIFIYYLLSISSNKTTGFEEKIKKMSLKKSFLFAGIGIVMIILGSEFVVNSASSIAEAIGVSQRTMPEAIEELSERERSILEDRFIIGKTQMEIAKEIGISQAQISRIEKNALERIRKQL